MRQAAFLQQLIRDSGVLSNEEQRAVDQIIAEFVRATVEDRPRAILVAFRGKPLALADGGVVQPDGDTVDDFVEGRIDEDRPYLVELLTEQIHPIKNGQMRTIVRRWDALRGPPADGPLSRLARAIEDPYIGLSASASRRFQGIVQDSYFALPKSERRRGEAGKYEPEIRKKVLAAMPEPKAKKLLETLTLLDAENDAWMRPGAVYRAYDAAVRLLESEGKAPAEESTP